MYKKGIDLSEHNGKVNWEKIECDFAIFRIGFGKGYEDGCLSHNLKNCKFPFGLYHFSYAYSVGGAELEADFVLSVLKKYNVNPTLPIFFDWEYDSNRYALQNGVSVDKKLFEAMAMAFMDKIRKAGYKAGIYYNTDYRSRLNLIKGEGVRDRLKYFQWLAYYYDSVDDAQDYDLWQNSDRGTVPGYTGDTNYLLNAELLVNLSLETSIPPTNETEETVYSTGRYIVTANVLTVREEPTVNSGWKRFENLSQNAQSQIMNLAKYKANGYVKGMVCDVSEVRGSWGRTPSGYICLDYCKNID